MDNRLCQIQIESLSREDHSVSRTNETSVAVSGPQAELIIGRLERTTVKELFSSQNSEKHGI